MAESGTGTKRRNRSAWTAAAVFALAVAGMLAVMGPPAWRAFSSISSDPVDVPGTVTRHLGAGAYLVLPHSGTTDQYGPVSISKGESTQFTLLEVTGPGGESVALEPSSNTSVNTGKDSYQSIARFHVDVAGDYTIRAESTPATTMLVVEDPFDGITERLAIAAVIAMIGLVAAIWWTVAIVRGARLRRTEQLPPPPDWSPGLP